MEVQHIEFKLEYFHGMSVYKVSIFSLSGKKAVKCTFIIHIVYIIYNAFYTSIMNITYIIYNVYDNKRTIYQRKATKSYIIDFYFDIYHILHL